MFGLESLADAMPSEVSQAQRKLVGLARALTADPGVLCLDEPAAGLDVTESEELGRRLRQIVDGGIPCSSSTTTWAWCSASRTTSSCSSSAR